MAIKLVINVSKKVPGPTDYSSVQASCSIEAEASGDPVAEAALLYRQAEAAVDQQLGITTAQAAVNGSHNGHRPSNGTGPTSGYRSQPGSGYRSASTHHPSNGHRGRRSPPPISQSQLGLIRRMLSRQRDREPGILQHYAIGSLDELDIAQASEVIDTLKGSA